MNDLHNINKLILGALILLASMLSLPSPAITLSEEIDGLNASLCLQSDCDEDLQVIKKSDSGDFLLAAYRNNSNITLSKFNYSAGKLIAETKIFLGLNKDETVIDFSISPNGLSAVVLTSAEKNNILLVDLESGAFTPLSSRRLESEVFKFVRYVDDLKVLFVSGFEESSKVLIFDIEAAVVSGEFTLTDAVESVSISKNKKNVIFTFSNFLSKSVAVFDMLTGELILVPIEEKLLVESEGFFNRISSDISGRHVALSSQGGKHVLHLLDVEKKKLISEVLNEESNGKVLHEISPDGKTSFLAGETTENIIKLYKVDISKSKKLRVLKTFNFVSRGSVLDLKITPDQRRVILLVEEEGSNEIRIFDFNTLNELGIPVVGDSVEEILLDDFGRYFLFLNTGELPEIGLITEINSGPIIKTVGRLDSIENSFVINGFVDSEKFSNNSVQVCFNDKRFCSRLTEIFDGGKTVSGDIPPGLSKIKNVQISAADLEDGEVLTSNYEGIFEARPQSLEVDSIAPIIKIKRPGKKKVFKKNLIKVSGLVDGTGSQIKSLTINGNEVVQAKTTKKPNLLKFNIILRFSISGTFVVNVEAIDEFDNVTVESFTVTIL